MAKTKRISSNYNNFEDRTDRNNYNDDNDDIDDEVDNDFDNYNDGIRHQHQHHPQRNAANARERARMRILSKAFWRLKTTLPWVPMDTKLSKLDTLRLATSYIAHLSAILVVDHQAPSMNQTSSCSDNNTLHNSPFKLAWPYGVQKRDSYGNQVLKN